MLSVLAVGALFAVLTLGSGLLLYAFVSAERESRTVTTRRRAERVARRDGADRDDR